MSLDLSICIRAKGSCTVKPILANSACDVAIHLASVPKRLFHASLLRAEEP